MSSPVPEDVTPDGSSAHTVTDMVPEAAHPRSESPRHEDHGVMNGSAGVAEFNSPSPMTPPKPQVRREPVVAATPRLKKKIPWKGKNILVLLPRDDERGQSGQAPVPLSASEVDHMLKSWEELGYNIDGFDLDGPTEYSALPFAHYSQSRDSWPSFEDIARERAQHSYKVTLPDLNAWQNYVNELNEAKLRALGVSFGDDDPPPPPSVSPGASSMSRQASAQYPPLPFSPPVPTSSASSAHPLQQFPFPSQSPGIASVASPVSLNGKLNPRQSISISPGDNPFAFPFPQQSSPHGFPPHIIQQGLHRHGSPSLANLNAIMSPTSPFSPDGFQPPMNVHQRHQSLQYPMLPHQLMQQSARASPRLQELREVDEETQSKSPSKTPEPAPFVRHNASASLQKEIDEAEYHLEEQFRSQLEHDEDYSPPNETEQAQEPQQPSHAREPSVQFAPEATHVNGGSEDGPVLHHPQPHSRGHSLSQKYFVDNDEARDSTDEGSFNKQKETESGDKNKIDEEIETNPSNLGTPVFTAGPFGKPSHQRAFSTTSNPWSDAGSASVAPRRTSHGSKPSLSKLNVEAPEFKFDPSKSFQPGQFVFSSNTFQPTVFQAGVVPQPPPSANSSQFSLPSTNASKINANAPAFSPGQSDFSFSASGPKFRPDAPTFLPSHSFSDSITTPVSGSESVGNRGSSIFGNIDLNLPEIVKPVKKNKAIPIVRPPSRQPSRQSTDAPAVHEDEAGRIIDESRVKRARGGNTDDDAVPLFAEPTPEPFIDAVPEAAKEEEPTLLEEQEEKQAEEEPSHPDTTMSSTIVSESTDMKDTTSPSEISPNQSAMNWAPFELKSDLEVQDFNIARPFGDDKFKPHHKKTLSATARPFIPGMSFSAESEDETDDAPADSHVDEPPEDLIAEPEAESTEPADPERFTSSPTPQPPQGLSSSRFAASPSPPPAPKGLGASRFAAASPSPPPKPVGLSASRFAATPSPVSEEEQPVPESVEVEQTLVSPEEPEVAGFAEESVLQPEEPCPIAEPEVAGEREPTFEEIDAIMQHMEQDPTMGVNKTVDEPQWHQPSPTRHISLAAVTKESPLHLAPHPQNIFRSDAPSPSPRQYHALPGEVHQPMLSTELEDPFVDPPQSAQFSENGVHHLDSAESQPASDWEAAFSDEEQVKLDSRANYFDGHVNEVVGTLLAARLDPLEKTLDNIQHVLAALSRGTPSSRREQRSISAELQLSDADDEDDEAPPRRSMSPRRDRRMEQIRVAVLDALAVQQRNAPPAAAPISDIDTREEMTSVLKAVEEMKEQFGQSLHLDFRGEDLRNIVEEAVERRMPPTPQPVVVPGQEDLSDKYNQLQARFAELEQRLHLEQSKSEKEVSSRRAAEDQTAEMERKLQLAETRIEVEIMNRSAYDQRVADLEDRLKHQEDKSEEEIQGRRVAEDRLSEVQRLLRISSEEENRLRELLEDREQKLKSVDETRGKSAMRLALLEAAQANAQKTQSDLQNRVNVTEVDLRDSRQEANHWRSEADRAIDLSRRQGDDLAQALDESKHMRKLIDTLGIQLQENERVREGWRAKFIGLQEDMSRAAREIAEENARRTKKEQAMLARQEVLDAKLQAEARTRERLETEIERLEGGERQGMRAVSECKRLEALLGDLKNENHKLQQNSLRYQAEFEEARESGAREVQRTRDSLQSELEEANHQVNVVREELEDQMSSLRAQLDQVKLDSDTAKARHEMLLEEAQHSKATEIEDLVRKHQNELEDIQARLERQLSNTVEDAQRSEQNLLERLSISNSKSEHLQDRVAHLEEKLEIAKEAALAAAQAAKTVSPAFPEPTLQPAAAVQAKVSKAMELPEKISPQALRESIMVLQEQLQEREQRIEELEQAMAKVDPEADTKISKRDDEIIWLRELLAVRHSDLQDIITALSRDDHDKDAVKDACIRLKANLQMEEQERERAMNGGSAINLPNIAATIRDAATPRVAQAVLPLAAAWGNWRKSGNQNAFGSLSGVLSSPAPSNSTPRRDSPASQSSFLSGLLTPPASGLRQTPPTGQGQPTAFSSTGRRFTPQDLANRPRGPPSARQADKMPSRETPPRRVSRAAQPVTPPMMRPSAYDSDAHAEDFDDAGFFDD